MAKQKKQSPGEIQVGKGSLGKAKQQNPNSRMTESMVPREFLDTRQEKLRTKRKPSGPESKEPGVRGMSSRLEVLENTQPTECPEPTKAPQNS